MSSVGRPTLTAVLALLVATTICEATPGTLRVRARFRDAPGIQSSVLEFLPSGTTVEILEVLPNQWRRVRLADGRVGFVWKDHFAAEGEVVAPPEPDDTVAADEQDIEPAPDELPAEAAGPEVSLPASAHDVQRLREQVQRLAAAQEDLFARLGKGGSPDRGSPLESPMSGTPIDGTAGAAALFLAIGAVFGWLASRIAQRRRDRRPKLRI